MAIVGYQTYREASNDLEEDAGARLSQQALNVSDVLDRNLFERYGDVQAYAKSEPAKSMDPERLTNWVDTMMATYTPIYKLMVVADMRGRIVAANTVDLDGEPLDTKQLIGRDVSGAK